MDSKKFSSVTSFVFLIAGLAFFSPQTSFAELCDSGDACSTAADCSNPSGYKWCHDTLGFCCDCCEFEEEINCPTDDCFWDSGTGRCRNEASTPCDALVPETPNKATYVGLIAGLAILSVGLAAGLGYRRKRKSSGN